MIVVSFFCLWTLISTTIPVKHFIPSGASVVVPVDVLGFVVAFFLLRGYRFARSCARLFLGYWMFVEVLLLLSSDPALDNDWIRNQPSMLLRIILAVMVLIQIWQAQALSSEGVDAWFKR